MLHRPKPYTSEQFKAWVDQQDPDASYNYMDNFNCAFAQFLKSMGETEVNVDGFRYYTSLGCRDIPHGAQQALYMAYPRTFGALSKQMELFSL